MRRRTLRDAPKDAADCQRTNAFWGIGFRVASNLRRQVCGNNGGRGRTFNETNEKLGGKAHPLIGAADRHPMLEAGAGRTRATATR